MIKSEYEVIVGNIGTVYSGPNSKIARKTFSTYVKQSKTGYGRAGGEDVTLMKDREIIKEHYGDNMIENPSIPKNKFIPCKAVKINSNGSISIKR